MYRRGLGLPHSLPDIESSRLSRLASKKGPAMTTSQLPTVPKSPPLSQDAPQIISIPGSRRTHEDRYLALRVNRKHQGVVREHGWLLAVMDGHGGSEASQAVQDLLPHAFQHAYREHRDDTRKLLRRAIALLDQDPRIKYQISAGTTLSMAYIADDGVAVHVAHLGDSPVVLFDAGGHILFRTEENNIITNPKEVERARELSVRRHGVDRIRVAEVVTSSGKHHPQYIKDSRMDDEFEAMFNEVLDEIENARRAVDPDYSLVDLDADAKMLTRIMRGKGIQNTAQLGAFPFDAILWREPQVTQVIIDPNRLPVYVLLATDGILDIRASASVPEVEKEIARMVAVEHLTAADLARKAGGDEAHDNVTVLLHEIPAVRRRYG